MERAPNINPSSHSASTWQQITVSQALIRTSEAAAMIAPENIAESTNQIAARLSKENLSVRDPFDPNQPDREIKPISQASFPEGVKKVEKKTLQNPHFQEQMNPTIGMHRRK